MERRDMLARQIGQLESRNDPTMGDNALYDAIFDDLTPAVWKMVKRDG